MTMSFLRDSFTGYHKPKKLVHQEEVHEKVKLEEGVFTFLDSPVDVYELSLINLPEIIDDFINCQGDSRRMKEEFRSLSVVVLLELVYVFLLASEFFVDGRQNPVQLVFELTRVVLCKLYELEGPKNKDLTFERIFSYPCDKLHEELVPKNSLVIGG